MCLLRAIWSCSIRCWAGNMEKETFLSGYCRNLDDARMVEVITEGSQLLEVDCDYGTCPHEQSCTIGQKIRQLLNET